MPLRYWVLDAQARRLFHFVCNALHPVWPRQSGAQSLLPPVWLAAGRGAKARAEP